MAAGLVVLLLAAGVAGAQVRGEPVLRAALSDGTVDPGESTTLSVTLANEADLDWASTTNPGLTEQVTTARAIRVELDPEDAPLSVETGEQLLGGLASGGATPVPFEVSVAEDAAPGTYEVTLELDYAYTSYVSADGVAFESDRHVERTLEVTVARTPQFRVVSTDAAVRSGELGRVSVTLENTGSAVAREASLVLESTNPGLGLGSEGASRLRLFAGAWEPGERRTFDSRVRAAEAPGPRDYTLDASVAYLDADGDERRSPTRTVGVRAAPTPSFAVEDVTASLRVDDRGTVSGTVTNAGPTAVRDVSVRLETGHPGLRPRSLTQPVGDLAPGESAAVAFAVDVAGHVDPGDYRLTLRPAYATDESGTLSADAHAVTATVAPEREPFELAVVNGTAAPDTEHYRFTVDVTNVGEVTRTDVVLRLASESPLSTTTPILTLAELAPGETATVTFELTVDDDAVEGRYPVHVNVTSDTDAAADQADGPYLLAVTVEEAAGGTTDLTLVGVAALLVVVLLGAGWWWLRS